MHPRQRHALLAGCLLLGWVVPSRVAGAAELPSVVHWQLADARRAVEAAGFKVRLEGGDPATVPELAFTVQLQQPAAGTPAAPGSVVTLRVYSAGRAKVVPDVVGLTPAAARQLLLAQGFAVLLEGGDPAPSAELAFRVQSQQPGAASSPADDAPVALRVHSAYDPSFASRPPPRTEAATSYVFDILAAGASDSALRETLGDAVAAFQDASGTVVKTFEAPQLGIAEATVWFDDNGASRWLRVHLLRSLPPRVAALLFDFAAEPEMIAGNPLRGWSHGVSLRFPEQGLLIFAHDDITVEIWRIDPALAWPEVAAALATGTAGE